MFTAAGIPRWEEWYGRIGKRVVVVAGSGGIKVTKWRRREDGIWEREDLSQAKSSF